MDNNNPYNRKKEPELNKQLIIDAATDIGAETDWHQVTFQAIADKTGLSKGGIIHHFKNKEELLDELVSRSFVELTAWMEKHKTANEDQDQALGYLEYIFLMKEDEAYEKTMRIVLQAILINPKYKEMWVDWYQKYIIPSDSQTLSTKDLILYLIADGLWYSERLGGITLKKEEKERVFNYINQLK